MIQKKPRFSVGEKIAAEKNVLFLRTACSSYSKRWPLQGRRNGSEIIVLRVVVLFQNLALAIILPSFGLCDVFFDPSFDSSSHVSVRQNHGSTQSWQKTNTMWDPGLLLARGASFLPL